MTALYGEVFERKKNIESLSKWKQIDIKTKPNTAMKDKSAVDVFHLPIEQFCSVNDTLGSRTLHSKAPCQAIPYKLRQYCAFHSISIHIGRACIFLWKWDKLRSRSTQSEKNAQLILIGIIWSSSCFQLLSALYQKSIFIWYIRDKMRCLKWKLDLFVFQSNRDGLFLSFFEAFSLCLTFAFDLLSSRLHHNSIEAN